MNCKNCERRLSEDAKYCDNCGGEVVNERIVFKKLFNDLWDSAFGLDNKYFITLKLMVIRPQVVITSYLEGTRKKYVRPFAFFAIAATLSLLVFNQFSDDYLKMAGHFGESTNKIVTESIVDEIEKDMPADSLEQSQINKAELEQKQLADANEQMEMQIKIQRFMLKYFNILSFLFLPFYTLMAFLVFRKPYNFGEHLIINAYLQGISFIVTVITFLISIFTIPDIYMLTLPVSMIYYSYAYGKLLKLSFFKSVLKFLKFLLILTLFTVALMLVGVLIGFLGMFMTNSIK